jgi:hypothetical protein
MGVMSYLSVNVGYTHYVFVIATLIGRLIGLRPQSASLPVVPNGTLGATRGGKGVIHRDAVGRLRIPWGARAKFVGTSVPYHSDSPEVRSNLCDVESAAIPAHDDPQDFIVIHMEGCDRAKFFTSIEVDPGDAAASAVFHSADGRVRFRRRPAIENSVGPLCIADLSPARFFTAAVGLAISGTLGQDRNLLRGPRLSQTMRPMSQSVAVRSRMRRTSFLRPRELVG